MQLSPKSFRIPWSLLSVIFVLVLSVALLSACGGAADTETPSQANAQATIAALTDENAALAGQVAAMATQMAELEAVSSADVQPATTGEESQEPGSNAEPMAPTSPLAEPAPTEPPPAPTATPLPPPTPLPTYEALPLDERPPEGFFAPADLIGNFWAADATRQAQLGWALESSPQRIDVVYQPFERGHMLWRGDTRQIYVLLEDGSWRAFNDTFKDGEMETDPAIIAPGGRAQPERGFGKVWREQSGVRESLGWATDREKPYGANVQAFQRGAIFEFSILRFALTWTPEGEPVWSQ